MTPREPILREPDLGLLPGRGRTHRRPSGRERVVRCSGAARQDRRVGHDHLLPSGLGGAAPWRSDRGVHRTTGPWTPTEHAFLRHLERVGFDGAPRVVGEDDEGREILTFVEGDVLAAGPTWRPGTPTPWPAWAQTEACLAATGTLLRRFHDAAASFVLPEQPVWRRSGALALGVDEVVCHGDVGPHNTVYRDGAPVAFIDWDTIRPGHPLVEVGTAAWKYVPLGDDAHLARTDFASRPPLPRRLAIFARAYGVPGRDEVGAALHQAAMRSVDDLRWFPVSPAASAAALRRVADELAWLDGALHALVAELD